jgi:hypothetical protein
VRLTMSVASRCTLKDLTVSARWTCILAVPAVLVVLAASVLLGGIHGNGQLPLMIAYAPIIALETVARIKLSGGPLTWIITVVMEWIYLFLAVTVFRALWSRLDR